MSDTHDKVPAELQTRNVDQMSPVVAAGMRILEAHPNPETLEKLLDVQLKWEAAEAKKAFTASLVALHRDLPAIIAHDRWVDYSARGSRVKYSSATLAKIITEIDPHLVKYGFNLSWESDSDSSSVTVTAVLRHEAGHSERTTLRAPHDNSGGKNPVQAIGSSTSYLQRYTAIMLLGLATGDVGDADEKPKQAPDEIDQAMNRTAVEAVIARGLDLKEAVAAVGKPSDQWTAADLEVLRGWILSKKKPEPAQAEPETDDELPWEGDD